MGFPGPKFTWTRGGAPSSFKGAVLDRALCNLEWNISKFKGDNLPKTTFEPVNLSDNNQIFHQNKFRFQAAWLTHTGFQNLIKGSWKDNLPLRENNNHLADRLKEWNRENFGHIERRKRRLTRIQKILANPGNKHFLKLDQKLRTELEDINQEELMWYQRSKEEWIKSGDRNTKFYHAAAMTKNQQKRVEDLKDDEGDWLTDPIALERVVQNYLHMLFQQEDRHDHPNPIPHGLLMISENHI